MNILQDRNIPTTESSWSALQSGQHRARQVCWVASAVPLLMLATVVVLRGGFPTPLLALGKIVGISLLVVNAAAFGSRKHWLLCGPMLSLLALMTITAIGLSPVGSSSFVAYALVTFGAVLCMWNFVAVIRRAGFLRTVAFLSLGLFLGLYAEGMYWRVYAVHDVLYPESILVGRVATDVVEQAAVVNMISTYRLASTGLDGLLPLKYHNGSLWIAEALRRLCGFRAIDFLGYGYGILLIPLYIVSFLSCAELLRTTVRVESKSPSFIFWAASAVAFVGVFPFIDNPLLLNFNEIVINSDSFLLAVTLSFLLIGAGVWFYESLKARGFQWRLPEKLALAIVLPAALALVGWVKISQVYLLIAVLLWLLIRIKRLRTWPFWFATLAAVSTLAVMLVAERGANLSRFSPLNFDRIAPEWIPYFFVFYFAWIWLLLWVWARFHKVRTFTDLLRSFQAGDSILVELAFVTAAAGMLPYLLIDFYSPAWKYFTEFQGVLAGVFFIAFLPAFQWRTLWQAARDGTFRLASALLVGLAVVVCGHLLITTVASTYRMLRRGCETRAVLAGRPDTAWRQELSQIKARHSVVVPTLLPRVELIHCLDRLADQPLEQRRGWALYIPKTNRTYWDMRQAGDGATPFIAPALAGIPMVDGLPEYEDIGWARVGWGYPQYQLPSGPEAPTVNIERAMAGARKDGFRELLVLHDTRNIDAIGAGCGIQRISL